MSKNLKRAISMLLAVVMVLGLLPAMAFAADTYTATLATGIPEGKDVAIYNASGASVFGSGMAGGAFASSAAVLENSTLTVKEGAGAYRFTKNDDGSYYITLGGKFVYAVDSSNIGLADTAVTGAKWKIETTSGGYHIYNVDVKYNGKDIYLEYYSGSFKLYSYNTKYETAYIMGFYLLEAGADADGDGRVGGAAAIAGPKPVDGQKVVIYNDVAAACFGAQEGKPDSASLKAIDSTLSDADVLTPGNGALIFTVHVDGEYYTFENNGKFLRTSENKEDGTNGEKLYFDDVESDYTKWTLEEVEGGYVINNKIAKYNNRTVCIEYFGSAFSGWTLNADISIFAMRFFAVEDTLDLGYVLNPKMTINAGTAHAGVSYNFKVTLDELAELTSMKVTASVDGGTPFVLEGTASEEKAYEYSYAIDGAKLTGKKLTIKGEATNSYNMTYSAELTVDISDEPLILSVSPAVNEATNADKQPEITVNIANCGENPTVILSVDGKEVEPTVTADKITYKPTEAMTDSRHTVYVKITRADGKSTEMTWTFFVGKPGIGLYFGQMHSHTAEYSDGAGTLEDAFEYASKAPDVDFLIVTDHSNYFDTKDTATTSSYYDLSSLTKTADGSQTKWEEARETAAKYTTDTFVAGYGYEMTWSSGPGHTNTFNTYGTISRNNAELNDKTGYAGMHRYNDLMYYANNGLDIDGNPVAEGVKTKYIEDAPVVSEFNHPGATFGNFDNFAGYNPSRDSVLSLIEVGNGEGAIGGSSYWPSYSQYDLALAKGWHVAPTNNQDNHKGKWGDANTARNVIVTDDFTEAGLYRAMAERRVYATEDQNLSIYYYLNDALMGTIIPVDDEETIEEVHIVASISDPDGEALGTIEIIGANGISLFKTEVAGSTCAFDQTIKNTDPYYYIKITQADGDIAVTAPVWVGEAVAITAIADKTLQIPAIDQDDVIVATLTNDTDTPYMLEKVEFYEIIKGEETLFATIEEAQEVTTTATFSAPIHYAEEGSRTFKVIFYGTYKNKAFKCLAELTVKVLGGIIRVGVDYGHDNYYLTGDYKDTAGNFIDFCAENGVLCEAIEKDEFTYERLSQYKLIVLTVPYLRKAGKADVYSEEEIASLARYAAEGGSVIICSKSDRDNAFDNCADNSNALLEAVGAHTRVVNGIIVDNDMKANEAYRIYFSGKENFNTEHPFTAGAYTSSNAFGTIPAPDNQTGFQVYNGAPIEIIEGGEETVEVLIRGYGTTWGSHYDGYFTGSSFVPEYVEGDSAKVTVNKGDVNVMTYEVLPGGGWCVTSGVTFFSNYDIKNEVEYANKYILRNIIRAVTKEETEPTPIAEVKAQSEGEYTIDGYVTSNASAYDMDTAFFDCIYVQDKQGNGINVFPVAGNFAIGMNVRCHGGITFYCGEVELNLGTDYNGSIRILSDELYTVPAKTVTCATAMSDAAIGNLMRVGGIVTEIHKTEGVIDKIYVRDATGEACVFINGYISKDYTGLDNLKVGMMIKATGIGSRDVDETSATAAIFARLRVRNRAEIEIVNVDIDVAGLFTDIAGNEWFFSAVEYAFNAGLLNGTARGVFEPDSTLTRAMVATVLYRAAGEPAVSGTSIFTDVEAGQWYTNAVIWAQANGIINGYEDNTFRPDNSITREEMAVMLARVAKLNGAEIAPEAAPNFPDAEAVSDWATEAIAWCVENGIINGMNGELNPQGLATRAQFATIMMRYQNQG